MPTTSSEILQALILTKDEEPNIERVLEKLNWLESVVILDSFSTDKTLEIAQAFSNVKIFQRKFDSFAEQCNYGLDLLNSRWVLSLDADYILTDEIIVEIKKYIKQDLFSAYNTTFKFLVFGQELMNDNTTPRPILFRRGFGTYYNDGHAHRLKISGKLSSFKSYILHDDRKSLSRWLSNQSGYSVKECQKLLNLKPDELTFTAKIRRTKIFAPFFVFFYCLFYQRLIFSGWHGWYYTLQRTLVEMLFALRLIEETKLQEHVRK